MSKLKLNQRDARIVNQAMRKITRMSREASDGPNRTTRTQLGLTSPLDLVAYTPAQTIEWSNRGNIIQERLSLRPPCQDPIIHDNGCVRIWEPFGCSPHPEVEEISTELALPMGMTSDSRVIELSEWLYDLEYQIQSTLGSIVNSNNRNIEVSLNLYRFVTLLTRSYDVTNISISMDNNIVTFTRHRSGEIRRLFPVQMRTVIDWLRNVEVGRDIVIDW